jgi:competence protein ComEC
LAFLDAVGARVALTSVSADNTYGHPSPLTMAHLTGRGALSFRTDLHGSIAVLRRDGELVVVGSR